jgi:hypothetical protein
MNEEVFTAKRYTDENGELVGFFIDHPDFYCDICPEDNTFGVYFRDKISGKEVYGEPDEVNFESAWKSLGYQYGEDALSNVRVGWDLRESILRNKHKL